MATAKKPAAAPKKTRSKKTTASPAAVSPSVYAIVEVGGRQWRVTQGSQLTVNRVATDVGSPHVVDNVLLTHDGTSVQIGRPKVAGAKVLCEVLEHGLGDKVVTYKFRRRENYRKTRGFRQPISKLLVKDIQL